MKKIIISLFALSGMLLSGLAQAEGSVARAIVTTDVVDREPVNNLERVMAGNDKVFFFTGLRGMSGKTIKHRWSYDGEVMAEVEFNVGGPRWRVFSSKNLLPEWAGEWKAEVVDAEGTVLSEKVFELAGDSMRAEEEVKAAETAVEEDAAQTGVPAEVPAEAPADEPATRGLRY